MQLYKEAKILSSPTGQLNNQNLSIKDLLKQQQEKKDASEHERMGEKPTEPFTYDDLKMHWRQFAHKQKNAGLETLYAALTMNEPALNGEKVVHTVDSLVHLEFIKSHEQDLVQHLRAVLKNYNLQIEFLEGTGEGGVKKPVTGNDKFEEMAKRNPNLKAFKKLFKLDIDF